MYIKNLSFPRGSCVFEIWKKKHSKMSLLFISLWVVPGTNKVRFNSYKRSTEVKLKKTGNWKDCYEDKLNMFYK